MLPLTFPFKKYSHLHQTKATFRTLSREHIRLTFETRQASEFCNNCINPDRFPVTDKISVRNPDTFPVTDKISVLNPDRFPVTDKISV